MTRWAGYCRVSTDEQARSGLGLEAQQAEIRRSVGLDDLLVDVFTEGGVSGSTPFEKRPGAQAMLDAIGRGEVDGIVVAKLDRMSRSVVHFGQLLDWCNRHGVKFRALDLGVDTSTDKGRMVAGIISNVAEWEWRRMGTRQRDAHASRRARGDLSGLAAGRPDVAARILLERELGATWQSIADALNRDGVPTPRGGQLWRVSSVQSAGGYRRPGKTQRQAVPSVLPRIARPKPLRRTKTAVRGAVTTAA